MKKILKALTLAAILAAPPALARSRPDPDAQLAKLLAGRVPGKPTSCITLPTVDSSTVIPGRAIVYRSGNALWVNRPTSGAETLSDNDILVTSTTTSQLCRIDTVRLVDRNSRFPRGFVILGDFVPYRRPR